MKDGSTLTIQGQQLNAALQYIPSQGYPPFLKTLKEFTQKVHQPPNWQDREIIITNGSQDGISKSIELCIEEGHPVIVQDPLYTGAEIVVSTKNTFLVKILIVV